MTWHPTEDDLILHFYGEGAPDDEARVESHVRECEACRASWEDLRETLQLVDHAKVPEPPAGFEARMWARVETALPSQSVAPARRRSHTLTAVFALAAAVVLAVGVAYVWRGTRQAPGAAAVTPVATSANTANPAADAARRRERVLLTALDDHFQQSEVLLVELTNGRNATDLNFERASAGDLVDSGRLYYATAQQNGDVQLAQMLEDLNAVLIQVARSPAKPTANDMASLRARINDSALLFKVRAVSSQIHDREKSLNANE
jgi:hypothetical protein